MRKYFEALRSLFFICLFTCFFVCLGFLKNKVSALENIENNSDEDKVSLKNLDVILLNEEDSVTVIFNLNGGNGEIPPQVININGKVKKPPQNPTRKQYLFEDWVNCDDIAWDFENDIVTEDITLHATWKWDLNQEFYNPKEYFMKRFPGSASWIRDSLNSKVTPKTPVEVKGIKYPREDIDAAIRESQIKSTYGGCGPLAMIGIFDYFSRYMGYTSISPNTENSSADRVSLAYDVFKNVQTYEVGGVGAKSTLTLPWDYVEGFNNLIDQYGLTNIITAENSGTYRNIVNIII